MLVRFKNFLSYAEWVALVLLVVALGYEIGHASMAVAVIVYIIAVGMAVLAVCLCRTGHKAKRRLMDDNHIMGPVMDICLLCGLGQIFVTEEGWYWLGTAGMLLCAIDFVRWLLTFINEE